MSNVTKDDLKHIVIAYHYWKNLNQQLEPFASRKVNIPESISEPLACYALGFNWHNKAKTKSVGDASFNGQLVEIKATSNFDDDLTSFSPKTKFDILIFARLNLQEDKLYLYNLNLSSDDFQDLQVNKTQKVSEQQDSKRRPRLSVIKDIIIPKNLHPVAVVDLQNLAKQLNIDLTQV